MTIGFKLLIHSDLRQILATWLERGLKRKGWSQAELARRAKPSRQTISRIATKTGDADAETLGELAKVLEWPLPALGKPIPETGTGDHGMDPIRTGQVMLAINRLEGAAKVADKLLNSNLLGPASNVLWDGMEAAGRELRGEGLAAPEQAPERRRPRTTRKDLEELSRLADTIDGEAVRRDETEEADPQAEGE